MEEKKMSREKHHVSKTVDSPIGRLTLVATDEGLAGILWENDRPSRVRLNIEAEDERHPVLVQTERQLEEYFAAGCRMVVVVHPRRRIANVYRSPDDVTLLTEDDVLDGGDVVPGWKLPLSEIFPFGSGTPGQG